MTAKMNDTVKENTGGFIRKFRVEIMRLVLLKF
jgi:hypothetical protein